MHSLRICIAAQMRCSTAIARRCSFRPYIRHLPIVSDQPAISNTLRCTRIFLTQRNNAQRYFSLSSIPTILLPPVVFSGLLITLWTYKCLMMIIFQNKIIYMPSMPPFSRSEKVADYSNECKPVVWREHDLKSLDGTPLKLLESIWTKPASSALSDSQKRVIVLYFQGNASSLPPRLPYLSSVLKLIHQHEVDAEYTIVALSYRGFWTSKGRPSQRGIELDAQAALRWVAETYSGIEDVRVVLWGQSIGAGVVTTALAKWLQTSRHDRCLQQLQVRGLLLETPFTSLRAMLLALYPQKFLPYRYLGPFLMSTWDSEVAFSQIGEELKSVKLDGACPSDVKPPQLEVVLLEAGNDELVPPGNAEYLQKALEGYNEINVKHRKITGALHTNVMMKSEGKREIVNLLRSVGRGS